MLEVTQKVENWIGGKWHSPKSGNYLENKNPATDQVIGEVALSQREDVEDAVLSAKTAFQSWSQFSREKRSKVLHQIADGIERNLETFALAESTDQGKPLSLAKNVEIPRAILNFRFFASAILHEEDSVTHMSDALNYTQRVPAGIAGLISPWNLPLYLLTWKIAPALAAGNTVVAKPSELTPMTAQLLAQVLEKTELPPGACNLIFGKGEEAGAPITRHPEVPLISFTGGSKTARSIISDSAQYFKKLSLELGGKNAGIVFSDTDLEQALPILIRSAFQNQGEICLCNSRLFVEKKIFNEFVERFVEKTKALTLGDPLSPKTDLGPLISEMHREKVSSFVTEAKTSGAEILTGGKNESLSSPFEKGYFYPPTVITHASPHSKIMQEEVFGPVVTLSSFEKEEEAIMLANGTVYGLSASLFTRDLSRAHRIAQKLQAGTIWINTWLHRDLRVPFGGMKASGVGREGGRHSLEFFTETKNICVHL